MPHFIEYASEEEWLHYRSQDISSTESAALFDLSPYTTKFELYHNKLGNGREFISNERMKWGNRLESAIAYGIAEDYGLVILPFKVYCRHDRIDRMGSSFDFMVSELVEDFPDNEYRQAFRERGCGIIEIKNVDGLVYRNNWTDDEAPDHIEVQVQHQMEVSGMTWTMICPLVGGNEAKPILRLYDKDVGAGLCKAVAKFWEDLQNGIEPKPDFQHDADFLIALHQNAGGNVLDATGNDYLLGLLKEYNDQGKAEKQATDRRKAIKAEVLELVDDASKVVAEGISLALTMVADSEPTLITADMVGQTYGGRKGYRNFRLTIKGEK